MTERLSEEIIWDNRKVITIELTLLLYKLKPCTDLLHRSNEAGKSCHRVALYAVTYSDPTAHEHW